MIITLSFKPFSEVSVSGANQQRKKANKFATMAFSPRLRIWALCLAVLAVCVYAAPQSVTAAEAADSLSLEQLEEELQVRIGGMGS